MKQKQKQTLVNNQIQQIRDAIKGLRTLQCTGMYLDARQRKAVYSIASNDLAPLQWV
jgi:hypothetical protein